MNLDPLPSISFRDMTKFDSTLVMEGRATGSDCVANPRQDRWVIRSDYLSAVVAVSLLHDGDDGSQCRTRVLKDLMSSTGSFKSVA